MIPNGTKFPSKTNAYGRKTRYEIATSIDNGKSSMVFPSDQRTRGGVQWAFDTREAAAKRCADLNQIRAVGLVNKTLGLNVNSFTKPPAFFEEAGIKFRLSGEFEAAAMCFEKARTASIGHSRRDRYEEAAAHCRKLDAERYAEAYPS